MKVLYLGSADDKSDAPWLKKGETYTVLSLYAEKMGVSYRILSGDPPTPVLHSAKIFEVLDGSIPSSWRVGINDAGEFMELTPEPWLEPGFWERYFDQDDQAIELFEQEVQKMDQQNLSESEAENSGQPPIN